MTAGDNDVVIAGTGIAGAVAACELRRRGFAVWMLEPARTYGARGIEALPAATVAAFHDLGLGACLVRAAAVAVRGFENAWEGVSQPRVLDGIWHHVERHALARALRDAALERGAHVLRVERLPPLVPGDGGGPFRWEVAGLPPVSRFSVDATGRAARWSRPVIRGGDQIATLFRGPGAPRPRRGRIVRTTAGWAYALFHPAATTVGVVTTAPRIAPRGTLSTEVADALELASPEAFQLERRCAAYPQWAASPSSTLPARGRFAVGDAALAYEPIAGQGVRFALASAVAAAACCATQRDVGGAGTGDFQAAAQYFEEFVGSARRRHLAQLDAREGDASDTPAPVVAEDVALRFAAEIAPTGLRQDSQIVAGVGIRLTNGELVRWLGRFDLLDLHELAGEPRAARELHVMLQERGVPRTHAEALVQWCVRHGVLSPIGP